MKNLQLKALSLLIPKLLIPSPKKNRTSLCYGGRINKVKRLVTALKILPQIKSGASVIIVCASVTPRGRSVNVNAANTHTGNAHRNIKKETVRRR